MDREEKWRKIYLLGAYADGVVYIFNVFENPRRQSLDSFIKERNPSAAKVGRIRDVTIDGFAGKSSDGGTWQAFATEDRLYEMRVVGVPSDDARITKFFSSVSFRGKKDSVEVTDGPGLPWEPPVEAESSDDEVTKKLYLGKEVVTKAKLGTKPEPSYTEEARQKSVRGTVVLKCVFAKNGSVTNIRIVSALPYGLTEKAIDAAKKIKFIPAVKDGKYVSMWMQLEYNFDIY